MLKPALFLLVIWSLLSCGFASDPAAPAGRPVWQPDPAKGAAEWTSENKARTTIEGLKETAELKFTFTPPPGNVKPVFIYGPSFQIPAEEKFLQQRWLRLSGEYRVEGLADSEAGLCVLARNQAQQPFWLTSGQMVKNNQFSLALAAAAEWKTIEVLIRLPQQTPDARLYLQVTGKAGTVWLRGLRISLKEEKAHLFSGGEQGVFFADQGDLSLEWADPDKIKTAKVVFRDEQGQVREEVPVAAGTAQTRLPLPRRGYFALEAAAEYADGTTLITKTTAAVLGEPLAADIRSGSRYGLMTVNGDKSFVARLGGRWDWSFFPLEKLPEVGDAPAQPLPAEPAKPRDPERTPIVAGGGTLPDWLQPELTQGKGLYPPRDWDKFARSVELWAKSKTNLPELLTVYNEPNAHWRGTQEELVKFHSVMAKALRAARPGTKVFGPCLYNINMPYFKQLVQLGVLDDLDGVVMHAYVDGTPPEAEFISRVVELKAYLEQVGKDGLPLYLTEFGWTTLQGTWQKPVDELTQARYVTRSLALLSTVKLDGLVYFCFLYHCANPGEHGFSLRRDPDSSPKPSLASYMAVTRWLTQVQGETRRLRLTPTVNLIVGRRPDGAVIVLWDTQAEHKLQLPFALTRAETFLGQPLETAGEEVAVSPSPVYLLTPETDFCDLSLLEPRQLCAGDRCPLAWAKPIVPAPLQFENGQLEIPTGTPAGEYLVLAKGDQGWVGQPIKVVSRLMLEEVREAWPLQSEPQLVARVRSYFPQAVSLQARLADESQKMQLPAEGRLEPGQVTEVPFALGARRQLNGKLELTVPAQTGVAEPQTAAAPVKSVFIGCVPWPAEGADQFWAGQPELDSRDWRRFGKFAGDPAADCSAGLKTAYGPDGLHLWVRVRDDRQRQDNLDDKLWQGDSLQLGFDADFDREWQPNNVGFGFNGHRVFEYSVALTAKGPQIWRHIAYDPVLSANVAESRVQARITRDGEFTLYELCFPWPTLGLSAAPTAGSGLGFALAVNDLDAGDRHGLELFGGIIADKDPVHFGKLWLR